MPAMIGVGLMMAGAAGGYFALQSGLLPFGESPATIARPVAPSEVPDVGYVPLDPLVISLTDSGRLLHLRFRAQVEVNRAHHGDVELLAPRITDVLNTYLRALEYRELQAPHALTVLRAQMLRRINVVVGEGRVTDLLIMEFVLS